MIHTNRKRHEELTGQREEDVAFYLNLAAHLCELPAAILTTHRMPDGDGIGAIAALSWWLQQKKIPHYFLLEAPLPPKYVRLLGLTGTPWKVFNPDQPLLPQEWPSDITPNLLILDAQERSRLDVRLAKALAFLPEQLDLIIDHHPPSKLSVAESVGDKTKFIDQRAAATAEMIGHLIIATQTQAIEASVAEVLYCAIVMDTNLFRYPSVTARTHALIAKLLETGISIGECHNMVFGQRQLHHIHFLGHILSQCQMNPSQTIAWLFISQDALQLYGVDWEQTHSYINHLLSLESIKVVIMFRGDGNQLNVSFRSHGDVDVAKLAQFFSGGGHGHAAACVLKPLFAQGETLSYQTLIDQVLARVEQELEK